MYLVFDLLYLNGEDLMSLPLVRRREILKKLLPKERPIRFSDAIEGRGMEFFHAARNGKFTAKRRKFSCVGDTGEQRARKNRRALYHIPIPPQRDLPISWNIAPSQDVLVIRYNPKAKQRSLDALRWGLIPYWAKDPKIAYTTFHDYSELHSTSLLNPRARPTSFRPDDNGLGISCSFLALYYRTFLLASPVATITSFS